MTIVSTTSHPVYFLRIMPTELKSKKAQELYDLESSWMKYVHDRLISIEVKNDLETSGDVSITLDNNSFFWQTPLKIDGVAKPIDVFLDGGRIEISMGYAGTNVSGIDNADNTRTAVRTYVISGQPEVSDKTMVVRGVSEAQNRLAVQAPASSFGKTTVSKIIRTLLNDAGFDREHRQIQDTVYTTDKIYIRRNETILAFLYRMAGMYNYRFYLTPGPDSKQIAHFHKPGWIPFSGDFNEENWEVSSDIGKAKSFTDDNNGHTDFVATTLRYRPSGEVDSDIKSISFKHDTEMTASTMKAINFDGESGSVKVITQGQLEAKTANLMQQTVPMLVSPAAAMNSTGFEPSLPNFPILSKGATPTDVVFGKSGVNDRFELVLLASSKDVKKIEDQTAALAEKLQYVLTAEAKLIGRPDILVGNIVEITGVPKYSGKYVVVKIRHMIGSSTSFTTDVSLTTDGVADRTTPVKLKSKSTEIGVKLELKKGGSLDRFTKAYFDYYDKEVEK